MTVSEDPDLRRSLRRWEIAGIVVLMLLVVLFPLHRAVEAANRKTASSGRQTTLLSTGRQLWADNCAKCHGERGEGVDAPALNSRQFQEAATPELISGLVRVGVPGTNMQSWSDELGGPLTDEQIGAITEFIRSFAPNAPDIPDWRTKFLGTPPPPPAGHSHMGTSDVGGTDMTHNSMTN